MSVNNIARLRAKRLKESIKDRCCRDLRYLAVDILGYNWMAGSFHREVFDFINENRDHPRVALFTPRYTYKSRIQICEIIQELLRRPDSYIALVHHKLDLARELVVEVGELLQKNEKLRELFDLKNRPGKKYNAFIKASQGGEFTLPGTGRSKPSLKGFSADQDLTGAHPDTIFLDDVISAKTVEFFNGVEGLRQWIRHTIIPLAGAAGSLRVKGTMWSPDDWYADIMNSKSWNWTRRAILEDKDGDPDENNGLPIDIFVGDPKVEGGKRHLTMEDIQRYKEEMKSHFPGQMMNNPRPEGSRPWNPAKCEHYVKLSQIRKYLKKIVILTDPAPLGLTDDGSLTRKDGNKDYWSIAVVGYMRSANKTVRVLLDGNASQSWTLDDGLNEIRKLMRKWNVKIVGIEEPPMLPKGVSFYGKSLKEKFSRAEQVMGQRVKPVRFKATHKGKAPRIFDLCSMAGMTDEDGDSDPLFIMCEETCDKGFLRMFLEQVRDWSGKNSIVYDDVLDSVAYLEDPAITELVRLSSTRIQENWMDNQTAAARPARKTRYCAG
jgi:hypothetical protein